MSDQEAPPDRQALLDELRRLLQEEMNDLGLQQPERPFPGISTGRGTPTFQPIVAEPETVVDAVGQTVFGPAAQAQLQLEQDTGRGLLENIIRLGPVVPKGQNPFSPTANVERLSDAADTIGTLATGAFSPALGPLQALREQVPEGARPVVDRLTPLGAVGAVENLGTGVQASKQFLEEDLGLSRELSNVIVEGGLELGTAGLAMGLTKLRPRGNPLRGLAAEQARLSGITPSGRVATRSRPRTAPSFDPESLAGTVGAGPGSRFDVTPRAGGPLDPKFDLLDLEVEGVGGRAAARNRSTAERGGLSLEGRRPRQDIRAFGEPGTVPAEPRPRSGFDVDVVGRQDEARIPGPSPIVETPTLPVVPTSNIVRAATDPVGRFGSNIDAAGQAWLDAHRLPAGRSQTPAGIELDWAAVSAQAADELAELSARGETLDHTNRPADHSALTRGMHRAGLVWEPRMVSETFASIVRERDAAMRIGLAETAQVVQEVQTALDGLPDALKADARAWLAGEKNALPDGLRDAGAAPLLWKVKEETQFLSHAMVERGILNPEALRQFENGFLARVFETDPVSGAKRQPRGLLSRVHNFNFQQNMPGVVVRGGGKKVSDFASQFAPHEELFKIKEGNDWLFKFKDQGARDRFVSALDDFEGTKVLETFEALTDADRAALKEFIDPEVPLYVTRIRAYNRIAQNDFLQKLLTEQDHKGRMVLSEDEFAAAAPVSGRDYVQHTDGPFAGKWVRDDVNDVVEIMRRREDALLKRRESWRESFWDAALRTWKGGKTALSPRTLARNVYSQAWFATMARRGWQSARHSRTAAQAILQPKSQAAQRWRQELRENGIIGVQFHDIEVKDVLNHLSQGKKNPGAQLAAIATLPGAKQAKGAMDVAGRIYNLPDEMLRTNLYIEYRTELGMSPRQAATEVNKWTPNYAEVGRGIDNIRRSPLGAPFFTFRAESYRVMRNALRERPAAFYAAMLQSKMLMAGTGWAMYELLGGFGEDQDQYQKELDALAVLKGRQTMPVDLGDDKLRSLDLQFIDPFSETQELALTAADGIHRFLGLDLRRGNPRFELEPGADAIEQVAGAAGVGENPITQTLVDAVRGEFPSGERLAGQLVPGLTPFLGTDARKLGAAFAGGTTSRFKPPQDELAAMLDAFLGLSTTEIDPDLEKAKIAGWTKYLLGKNVSDFRKDAQTFHTLESFGLTAEELRERQERIAAEARRALEAAEALRR